MSRRIWLALAVSALVLVPAGLAMTPAQAGQRPSRPAVCRKNCPTPTATTPPPTPTPTATTPPPATGTFTVSGTRIIDPGGATFIPVGGNVNGPEFVWGGPTIGESAAAANTWHWNTIRLNVCWAGADNYPDWNTVWPGHPAVPAFAGCENGGGWHWPNNNDLDALVAEYTARHIVVMIDLQHFDPGTYPNATAMPFVRHWWSYIAARYASNPYVWFNPLNEPGGDPSTLAQWNQVTGDLAATIRATGATNIIVADGSNVGQEAYDWTCGADIPYANSGILTYGPALQAAHGNMVFSLHAYNEWGGANRDQWSGCSPDPVTFQSQLDTRMRNYLDHVKAANVPLLVGELGSHPPPVPLTDWDAGQDAAVETVFRIAPGYGVGTLWWHGDDGSSYFLLTQGGSGSCSWEGLGDPSTGCVNPTLTRYGRLLYDYAHQVNP